MPRDTEFEAAAAAYYDERVDMLVEQVYGAQEQDEPQTCSICDGLCSPSCCPIENDERYWHEAEEDRRRYGGL